MKPKLPECKNPAMVSHSVKGSPCSQEGAKRKAEGSPVAMQEMGFRIPSTCPLPAIPGEETSNEMGSQSYTTPFSPGYIYNEVV